MIGRSLAHYEITAELGKGGMGEVFRARDTKLEREVALKVLPTEMSGDPERKARFEREARSLASLQHPNVASIYGFEEADGVRFLVMELVEGEDLSQRLEKGPIPVAEARSIAAQIAAGLEVAHDNGLVHRDLKPANVMVSAVGDVKILDFGLARAWFGEIGEDADPAMSPTITAAMTQAGTILGTAAYMSPEQARGRKVDRRADIWAFGVILYEMLVGEKLFEAETVSDTMAAVLRAEPDWSKLPTGDAPELCHLAERCLQRDPKQRLRDIGEARIMLEPGGASVTQLHLSAPHLPSSASQRRWPAMVAIALVFLVVGGLAGMRFLARSEPAPVVHAMIAPPVGNTFDLGGGSPGPAVISPDGKMVTFSAIDEDGQVMLWLRHVDRDEAAVISGTLEAAYPFWSPDSKMIGFFELEEGRLRKVAAQGGPPTTLCPAPNGKGGAWNEQGVIIFAPDASAALQRVMATGGAPDSLTTLEGTEGSHRHPRFLPDGEHYLFLSRRTGATDADHDIYIGRLGSSERRQLTVSQSNAEYASGHLLTVREQVLMATLFPAPFDGTPKGGFPLVENVAVLSQGSAIGVYSASRNGMMIYQTGRPTTDRVLSSTHLQTGATAGIGEAGPLFFPSVSPDGTRAMVELQGDPDTGTDLWLVDLATGLRTRFTFAEGDESHVVWTPDGSAVAYTHSDGDMWRVMLQPVEGTAPAEFLLDSEVAVYPTSIDPTGKFMLLDRQNDGSDVDIIKLTIGEGTEPEVFVDEGDDFVGGGVWSPDGRWVLYHAVSAQRFDVFVVPASGPARKWQVSRIGAVWPQWSGDGSSVYCTTFDGTIMKYDVNGTGETFRIGDSSQTVRSVVPSGDGRPFFLHPDGERVFQSGATVGAESDVSLLHLVTDWQRGLAR